MSPEARIHTHVPNRAQRKKTKRERPHADAPDRKPVLKSALADPLNVEWPDIPLNVQNSFLATLARILLDSRIALYHEDRERFCRKLKQSKQKRRTLTGGNTATADGNSVAKPRGLKRKVPKSGALLSPEASLHASKRRKLDHEASPALPLSAGPAFQDTAQKAEGDDVMTLASAPTPPQILPHLVFGINEVTKRLEAQIMRYRQPPAVPRSSTGLSTLPSLVVSDSHEFEPISNKPTPPISPTPLRFIFACTQDIEPPALVAHFPSLIAVLNASRPNTFSDDVVALVRLPKNAEGVLSEAIGLRRVAVMALDASTPGIEYLEAFISSLPILTAPWLVAPDWSHPHPQRVEPAVSSPRSQSKTYQAPSLAPTQIRQIRTTAPRDQNASKEARAKGRARITARATITGGGTAR